MSCRNQDRKWTCNVRILLNTDEARERDHCGGRAAATHSCDVQVRSAVMFFFCSHKKLFYVRASSSDIPTLCRTESCSLLSFFTVSPLSFSSSLISFFSRIPQTKTAFFLALS
ncbi:hypothetical protein F7725_015746 [Dissostichus mawsoni]|uniref:Uncharacterized protein n=1 Tax=Dissostichus mawsoni TaxID=36200 RepID=A0A7J5YKH7_DISMA|nr:hypothetical protein F7725_015746 [Dissostichus mawsoni]